MCHEFMDITSFQYTFFLFCYSIINDFHLTRETQYLTNMYGTTNVMWTSLRNVIISWYEIISSCSFTLWHSMISLHRVIQAKCSLALSWNHRVFCLMLLHSFFLPCSENHFFHIHCKNGKPSLMSKDASANATITTINKYFHINSHISCD